MNLIETILKAGGGAIVKQLGQNLGLNQSDTQSAIGKLIPALSRGLQNNISSGKGIEGLIQALTKSNPEQYLQTERLNTETPEGDPIKDGNDILGAIFGSKDVSRNVAGHAAQETGIDSAILKKMLPMLATLVIGFIVQKSTQDSSSGIGSLIKSLQSGQQADSKQLSGLTAFLDFDKDGSIVDDVLGMARKFL